MSVADCPGADCPGDERPAVGPRPPNQRLKSHRIGSPALATLSAQPALERPSPLCVLAQIAACHGDEQTGEHLEAMMKALMIGVAALALMGPAAYAQTGMATPATATDGQVGPGEYMVFFDFDRATLNEEGRQVVAQAAEAYRPWPGAGDRHRLHRHSRFTGRSTINDFPNSGLGRSRSNSCSQGVPASSLTIIARGQDDLLVPTADGVRQPENRRVEIVVPSPSRRRLRPREPVEPPPPPPRPPEPDHFLSRSARSTATISARTTATAATRPRATWLASS